MYTDFQLILAPLFFSPQIHNELNFSVLQPQQVSAKFVSTEISYLAWTGYSFVTYVTDGESLNKARTYLNYCNKREAY